tara:strand:+ start:323 stop:571 length:249 start_codon:yes stop_codon:yes gene_type:complete
MFNMGDLVHLPERAGDLQEDYGIILKVEKKVKPKNPVMQSWAGTTAITHYYHIWWLNDQKDTREDNIWAHEYIKRLARGKHV